MHALNATDLFVESIFVEQQKKTLMNRFHIQMALVMTILILLFCMSALLFARAASFLIR